MHQKLCFWYLVVRYAICMYIRGKNQKLYVIKGMLNAFLKNMFQVLSLSVENYVQAKSRKFFLHKTPQNTFFWPNSTLNVCFYILYYFSSNGNYKTLIDRKFQVSGWKIKIFILKNSNTGFSGVWQFLIC